MSKYLSFRHRVSLVTSAFRESFDERTFDIGKAELVEIPLKFYMRNPYRGGTFFGSKFKSFGILDKHKLKAELLRFMEKFFPVSAGGMLYHDFKLYRREIAKRLCSNVRNILITTYDPWFALKLGSYFKKRSRNLTWIADFRDPSFNVHESVISQLSFFELATRRMLQRADLVTVVTEQCKRDYEKLKPRRVMFLPNGFDGDLCWEKDSTKLKSEDSLVIAYTGSLHPGTVEISFFVDSLKQAMRLSPRTKFIFHYAGLHGDKVEREFCKKDLGGILKNHGLLRRDEALRLQRAADVLLLIAYTGDDDRVGGSMRTGKVYEYLASGKPIIVIAPQNWEMKKEVELDRVSKVFQRSQIAEIAQYLVRLAYTKGIEIDIEMRKKVIEKYLYRNLATEFEKKVLDIVNVGSGKT